MSSFFCQTDPHLTLGYSAVTCKPYIQEPCCQGGPTALVIQQSQAQTTWQSDVRNPQDTENMLVGRRAWTLASPQNLGPRVVWAGIIKCVVLSTVVFTLSTCTQIYIQASHALRAPKKYSHCNFVCLSPQCIVLSDLSVR